MKAEPDLDFHFDVALLVELVDNLTGMGKEGSDGKTNPCRSRSVSPVFLDDIAH